MAKPRNGKRHRANGAVRPSVKGPCPNETAIGDRSLKRKKSSFDESSQLQNKVKSTGRNTQENFSPNFWDSLPNILLAPRSLRELDRRRNLRPRPGLTKPDVCAKTLARFARRGGPDLRHLRGYPDPEGAACMMAPNASPGLSSRSTRSTAATSLSPGGKRSPTKTRKTSAYDGNFETHLIENNVYRMGYRHANGRPVETPGDLEDTRHRLSADRRSLSPYRSPDSAFDEFQEKNREVVFEKDVMNSVIPVLCGDTSSDIPNQQNILLTQLSPLTTEKASKLQPDFFDGTRSEDVLEKVKDRDNELNIYSPIVPSKHPTVPVAPNFFLEAKGPDGSPSVVRRQACYDGAYGARVMHSLQSYGREDPVYDGNAYAFSSTYHVGDRVLHLYAHHMTAPQAPTDRPGYYMTKLRTFSMTDSCDEFVEGVTAFRNLRDLARQHRDSFVAAANARASQPQTAAAHDLAGKNGCADPSSEPKDRADYLALQHADDAFRQNVDKESATPQCPPTNGTPQEAIPESAEPASDDRSARSPSSRVPTKRPRQSHSPPPTSKRTRPSTG